jgi:hypothetical protein
MLATVRNLENNLHKYTDLWIHLYVCMRVSCVDPCSREQNADTLFGA